jgi:hypothetical protein
LTPSVWAAAHPCAGGPLFWAGRARPASSMVDRRSRPA